MSVFKKLRELENDNLTFPEMEHGTWDLRIEATSDLKGTVIDEMIREKLSDIYVLENMQCKSFQDPPPVFYNTNPYWEDELKEWKEIPRHTYYTFLYDIAKVKPSNNVLPNFDADNLALLKENSVYMEKFLADQGQEDCTDCKDGFYYPFVGPRETCDTCNGTKMVTVGKPPALQPATGDDLKDDFGQYVSQMLEPIDLGGICKTSPYTDFFTYEERDLKYCITETDMWGSIKWDGNEFGRRFCEAVKVDILRLTPLAITKEVKLHFDFSTLRIEYNLMVRSYEMFIVYHMKIVK